MQPIRLVFPGADTTLPLRLMQIGAGIKLGLTIYILGEGRYTTAPSFPEATLDLSKLVWDAARQRSNYQNLVQAAMATGEERSFVTEYARHPNLDPSARLPGAGGGNPGVAAAYAQACPTFGEPRPAADAAADATSDDASGGEDADTADAGSAVDEGGAGDAGPDAGDAGPTREVEAICDDLDVAFAGMKPGDAWITRMRADLRNAALADTLRFAPAPQEVVENIHQTTTTGTVSGRIARAGARSSQALFVLGALGALFLVRTLRRRRLPRE